jgi:hypothetical protein
LGKPVTGDRAAWAATAELERDRRADSFPRLVKAGTLSADAAQLEYQCWYAIHQWLATDRFTQIEGGVDGRTVVDWLLCEAVAEKALGHISALAERKAADPAADPAQVAELNQRCANLRAIHRALQLRRQTIEAVNDAARKRELEQGKVAA